MTPLEECLARIEAATAKYRDTPDAVTGMRVSHLKALAATHEAQAVEIRELRAEIAAMGRQEAVFEIDTSRDVAPYRILEELAVQRMQGRA